MDYKLDALEDSSLECPRCQTAMKDCGALNFITKTGHGTHPFWLASHLEGVELQTYACPNCGKVEFFL